MAGSLVGCAGCVRACVGAADGGGFGRTEEHQRGERVGLYTAASDRIGGGKEKPVTVGDWTVGPWEFDAVCGWGGGR